MRFENFQASQRIGRILFLGITACSLMILLVTSFRANVAADTFWHLQMGKDWLENGLSPWVDHYSFTFTGSAIVNPPVLFQVFVYLALENFGAYWGTVVIRVFFYAAILTSIWGFLLTLKVPAIVRLSVLVLSVLLLQYRVLIRPELLGYAFAVIALWLNYKGGKIVSKRTVLPMVFLVWAWSFYHSSVTGYVIFAGFFLDCAVRMKDERSSSRQWVNWFAWGMVTVGVGFMVPHYAHPILETLTLGRDFPSIIEYRATLDALRLRGDLGALLLIPIVIFVPFLAVRRKEYGTLLIWAVMLYAGLSYIRMFTLSGIVILLLSAQMLAASEGEDPKDVLSGFAHWAMVITICIAMMISANVAMKFMKENLRQGDRYPGALATYMLENQMRGRVFNQYKFGGYLIFRLAPNNTFYIDGRTGILYPSEHFEKYRRLLTVDSVDEFEKEFQRYQIDHIAVQYEALLHDHLMKEGQFELEFFDSVNALYTRAPANFPLLGRLLTRPGCWQPDGVSALMAEHEKVLATQPEQSALRRFSKFVLGYSQATDQRQFFDDSVERDDWDDAMRRFAGVHFLLNGELNLASINFQAINNRIPIDYLAALIANLKIGDQESVDIVSAHLAQMNPEWMLPEERRQLQKMGVQLDSETGQAPGSTGVQESSAQILDEVPVFADSNMTVKEVLCPM